MRTPTRTSKSLKPSKPSVTVINDDSGRPAFAMVPLAEYHALKKGKADVEYYVPSQVVNFVFGNEWTPVRAWREHLQLTQAEVAERLGISQPAYAQQEISTRLRRTTKEKIAEAFGIHFRQLHF
jgi:DNA-binding XRE family transcriptional regulator